MGILGIEAKNGFKPAFVARPLVQSATGQNNANDRETVKR